MSGKPQTLRLAVDNADMQDGPDWPPGETRVEKKKRQRREGMRRLRQRENRGEGLAQVLYNWRQVTRMVARGQISDAVASDPDRLRSEVSRIASDLMRREFGD